ncbi:MAG: V-type ATP synthase subunit E [Candidatus Merdivicinus sp.]
MGAEAILDKIRKNAEEEAAALRKQGEEKAEAAAAKIRADAEAEADFLLQSAMKTVDEMERREMLMAGLETRKNTLAARRAVMDEAFADAFRQLMNLPEGRWRALILRLVMESAETGTEVLEIPAADREKYESVPEGNLPLIGEKSFLKQLNAALKDAGREGKLTLADAPAGIAGGFRLSGPVYDVNASFEMLVSLAREEMEQEIYRMLYPQES